MSIEERSDRSNNEIKVRLVLCEFPEDPDEITHLLGIQPTLLWRVGDSIGGTERRHSDNGWSLSSPISHNFSVEDQLHALLKLIDSVNGVLRDLGRHYYLEISCIIYARESVPSIHFSSEVLQRIADLEAAIDVDLYCLDED